MSDLGTCPYCWKPITASNSANGGKEVPFCGCKKSRDAMLANLKRVGASLSRETPEP